MKNKIFVVIIGIITLTACHELDLNPLSEGSSENWYSNETEIDMALNDLYREVFWPVDDDQRFYDAPWTDNRIRRNAVSPILAGTITGQWARVTSLWSNCYSAIARANTVLLSLDRAADEVPEAILNRFAAEARFIRASQYALLISHFGDVVFYTDILDLEEAFNTGRTDKATVLQAIYEDYDFAAQQLPENYGNDQFKRATKGAAFAMKSRIALYNNDWEVARNAAKTCMDLNRYQLYPDYGELFLVKTKNTDEMIFGIPFSETLGLTYNQFFVRGTKTRNSGGHNALGPSWDLFCSYLCTDGLPIDESLLFNPQKPFENRDPRCTETLVEFGTPHLGFIFEPHPDSLEVLNLNSGNYQTNNDSRGVNQFAQYDAIVRKKGVDEEWLDERPDPDKMLMRYADVLLMYAEASIEMDQIDQSVLDALNMVRARAYGVSLDQTDSYPAITTMNQEDLRKLVRIERRMEFAYEGLRYMDLIRWRIAEKVLTRDIYGMLDPAELREKVVNPGLWFFPATPEIDEDGNPDFSALYEAGFIKRLAVRNFDASKQYLWPIPTSEILINDNLDQNPGY
jgi:starch-binding outer membrane protein, SusD/RagB family